MGSNKLPEGVSLPPGIHGPDANGKYIQVYSDGTYNEVDKP